MSVDPASLSIVHFPNPVLREKAHPVVVDDDSARKMVRDVAGRMIDLMHEADGVGLAGPQVGLPWRIFVTNAREADPEDRVFINPQLTLGRGEIEVSEEGCLSLPSIHVNVRRPVTAEISAVDLDGQTFSMSAEGILARIWQHEFDHLDGVLIIDRMSPMDRLSTRRALKDLKEMAAARDAG